MAGPCPHFQCLFRIHDRRLPPVKKAQRSGVSRDPCKHKQLSGSRAPLAGSRRHFHPHEHVGKVALQGRLQPLASTAAAARRRSGDESVGAELLLPLLGMETRARVHLNATGQQTSNTLAWDTPSTQLRPRG